MDLEQALSPSDILAMIKGATPADLNSYQNFKKLLYCDLFLKIPVIVNKIPKGEILYRTVRIFRKDTTMGRKQFVSYRPPHIEYPFFNRCSEPGQTHFYCSTDRHLSLAEVSYFISKAEDANPVFEKDEEQLEIGVWEVMEDLYVADLRFGSYTDDESESHVYEIKDRYKSCTDEGYVFEFFDFINNTFEIPIRETEHLKYWLTACYSNYMFDDKFKPQELGTLDEFKNVDSMSLDGILYRSVKGIKSKSALKGYNFALSTKVIDAQKLKLTKAGVVVSRRTGLTEFLLDDLNKIKTDISSDSWYYNEPKT